MFSGIVEAVGIVSEVIEEGSNKHFVIKSEIASEAYIDQSISHNGACLTVVEITQECYKVTAISETLVKTNLGNWKVGDYVNLERSITVQARIDGHFVQGHVDTTLICTKIDDVDGSWYFDFDLTPEWTKYVVNKGSICINGVSLTVVEGSTSLLRVAIIPYTYEHTNFKTLQVGDSVNIEFDIFGKYVVKYLSQITEN